MMVDYWVTMAAVTFALFAGYAIGRRGAERRFVRMIKEYRYYPGAKK